MSVWAVFAKRRIEVACSLQDALDIDPVTDRQVEDEGPVEREAPDPGGALAAWGESGVPF